MVNKIEMIGVLFTFKICAAQSTQKHILKESDEENAYSVNSY